jgi:hypothetical protein
MDMPEKNALAILRMTQKIHGGDLVFDSRGKLVSLLVFSAAGQRRLSSPTEKNSLALSAWLTQGALLPDFTHTARTA